MRPCFICGEPSLCEHREEGLVPMYLHQIALATLRKPVEPEKGTHVNGTTKTRVV